jgi:hypothetical protein
MKTCKKCNQTKVETDFYKDNSKSDGLTIYCKLCSKEKEKLWHKQNPKIKQLRNMKHILTKDGKRISLSIYESMLESQNKKCGICEKDMDKPYVDHDHTTGIVRMLLCHHCNTLLGMAKEDKTILENAINYINKFKSQR